MARNLWTEMNYVARRPCGCIVMAAVVPAPDAPKGLKRDIANEVAACIKDGYTIEQVTTEWVRNEARWECEVCNPQNQAKLPGMED